MRRIVLAQTINQRVGGALIAPWQVDTVPEEYLEAFRLWTVVDSRLQAKQKNEKVFTDFRRKMNYRQY